MPDAAQQSRCGHAELALRWMCWRVALIRSLEWVRGGWERGNASEIKCAMHMPCWLGLNLRKKELQAEAFATIGEN